MSSIEEIQSRKGTIDENIATCDREIEYARSQKAESDENLKFIEERIADFENSVDGYRMKLELKTKAAEDKKEQLDKLASGEITPTEYEELLKKSQQEKDKAIRESNEEYRKELRELQNSLEGDYVWDWDRY